MLNCPFSKCLCLSLLRLWVKLFIKFQWKFTHLYDGINTLQIVSVEVTLLFSIFSTIMPGNRSILIFSPLLSPRVIFTDLLLLSPAPLSCIFEAYHINPDSLYVRVDKREFLNSFISSLISNTHLIDKTKQPIEASPCFSEGTKGQDP